MKVSREVTSARRLVVPSPANRVNLDLVAADLFAPRQRGSRRTYARTRLEEREELRKFRLVALLAASRGLLVLLARIALVADIVCQIRPASRVYL